MISSKASFVNQHSCQSSSSYHVSDLIWQKYMQVFGEYTDDGQYGPCAIPFECIINWIFRQNFSTNTPYWLSDHVDEHVLQTGTNYALNEHDDVGQYTCSTNTIHYMWICHITSYLVSATDLIYHINSMTYMRSGSNFNSLIVKCDLRSWALLLKLSSGTHNISDKSILVQGTRPQWVKYDGWWEWIDMWWWEWRRWKLRNNVWSKILMLKKSKERMYRSSVVILASKNWNKPYWTSLN